VSVENALVEVVRTDARLGAVRAQQSKSDSRDTVELLRSPQPWGEQGSPVLPAVLIGWSSTAPDETDTLLRALGLPEGTPPHATFERRAEQPLNAARLGAALSGIVATGVGVEPAMGSVAPDLQKLDPATFYRAVEPLLRTRTANVVRRDFGEQGLLAFLRTATVGDVMSLRQFGVVSFFDLLVAAEAAAAMVHRGDAAASAPESPEPLQRPTCPPWAGAVMADDPRFRHLLGPAASLRELFEESGPRELMEVRRTVEETGLVLQGLAGLTLEQEAESVLGAALHIRADRWLEAMGSRYGLDGTDPLTLAEIAVVMGVTRERVRQVQSKAQLYLPTAPVHAPAVDQVIELLDWALPCTEEELAAALAAGGLTALPRWSAGALRSAVGLTGRTIDIDERGGVVGRPSQLRLADSVSAAARAVSNGNGIASAATVARRLSRGQDEPVSVNAVEPLLHACASLHWIDETWFWTDHPPGRNRLVNTSLRILAVIGAQTLDDLLEGIEREYAFRASTRRDDDLVPPGRNQLEAFYASHPVFRQLDGGLVEATEPVDIDLLGEEKQALVAVLRGQPHQAMDRLSLLAACDEIGMKPATVTVWTTYAGCIKRFAPNVWGLRGAHVPDEVLVQLQANARRAREAVDRTKMSGTTPSGRPWTARRVTPSFLYSGVMPFDWGKPMLAYRTLAAVDMVDGESVGTVRFAENFNWGYGTFLRRHDVRQGDVVRVLADPESDTCYLELGGDELLSEPFDA
jgi:hypothetical protein